MKKILLFLPLILILLMVGASAWAYPRLPEQIAAHWNAAGQADGAMSVVWGLALAPLISLAMYGLLLLLPKLDPLHPNDPTLRQRYAIFSSALVLFFAVIHGLLISWNFGIQVDVIRVMSLSVGLLFVLIGHITRTTKRNWFMGIRTPWTLSSDVVWEKTNRLGGKLFMVSGAIGCLGALLPSIAIWLLFVPVVISTIFTLWYSWRIYNRPPAA